MDVSQVEVEAIIGINEADIEMAHQLNAIAPPCHFRPMLHERGDGENYVNIWSECSVCGHAKQNLR